MRHIEQLIARHGYHSKEVGTLKKRFEDASARYLELSEHVRVVESHQGILERWSADSKEYRKGLDILLHTKYRQAVDHLEHLLVQRMFELTKLGMSGTGKTVFSRL